VAKASPEPIKAVTQVATQCTHSKFQFRLTDFELQVTVTTRAKVMRETNKIKYTNNIK